MSAPNDEYQPSDSAGGEGFTTADTTQDDYKSRTGQSEIPVVSDSTAVEEGGYGANADSDEQLKADDKDAIDEGNIVDGRTRGSKPSGGYAEPGDEEGLPTDDGTSSGA